jgi:hypothetical protein
MEGEKQVRRGVRALGSLLADPPPTEQIHGRWMLLERRSLL